MALPGGAGVSSHNEQVKRPSIDLPMAKADLEPVINACLSSVSLDTQPVARKLHGIFDSASTTEDLLAVLGDLASLLSTAVLPSQTWIVTPWTLLADLSKKEPSWRQLFGPLTRTTQAGGLGEGGAPKERCILGAAVQAIQLAAVDSLPVIATRPVIRLLANCCADNNVNRSTVINSPALDALQSLVLKRTEIDILLPALYNICTDFDEPAQDDTGQPYHIAGQLTQADLEAEFLTKAEAKLQAWTLLEVDDNKLLEASDPSILADLIEMSTRSALFDISITLRDDHLPSKSMDDDLAQRAVTLSHKLLNQGTRIASTSTEAQASICQACLNLYSQPVMQKALAQSSKDIELFIELPYLTAADDKDEEGKYDDDDDDDEDIDLSSYRESFLKLLYAVSALPEYQSLASPDSDLVADLTQSLARYATVLLDRGLDNTPSPTQKQVNALSPDTPSPLPSILALLNNALCSLERVEAFLNCSISSSTCRHIMAILLHTTTPKVLLPSLSLANRLALSPAGAEQLYAADRDFSVLSRLLHKHSHTNNQTTANPDEAAITHEILAFARLLVKSSSSSSSSPSIALALVQNPVYSSQLLPLASSSPTLDDTTTTTTTTTTTSQSPPPPSSSSELARLNTAILRIIAATTSTTTATTPATATTTANLLANTITSPNILPLFTSSLVNNLLILTPAPTTTTTNVTINVTINEETLFGLAIFASLFIAPSSRHYNPSVKPVLLSRLAAADCNHRQQRHGGGARILKAFQNLAAEAEAEAEAEEEKKATKKPSVENLQILLAHLLSSSSSSSETGTPTTEDCTEFLNELSAIASSFRLKLG